MKNRLIPALFFFTAALSPLFSDPPEEQLTRSRAEARLDISDAIPAGDLTILDYPLSIFALGSLNNSELRILRNMIYARHGYTFSSSDLADFFSSFEWYTPTENSDGITLSSFEKSQIEQISSFERRNPGMEEQTGSVEALTGVWNESLVMAAGFADTFRFYPDGRFIFHYSQMRELPLILRLEGEYTFQGNTVKLTILRAVRYREGGKYESSGAFGYQWESSEEVTEECRKEVVLRVSPVLKAWEVISGVPGQLPDELDHKQAVNIGGKSFFRYSGNPDDYN